MMILISALLKRSIIYLRIKYHQIIQDLQRLLRLRPELQSDGCDVCQSNSYVWKIFHLTDSSEVPMANVEYRYPFCDIFVMKMHKNK